MKFYFIVKTSCGLTLLDSTWVIRLLLFVAFQTPVANRKTAEWHVVDKLCGINPHIIAEECFFRVFAAFLIFIYQRLWMLIPADSYVDRPLKGKTEKCL